MINLFRILIVIAIASLFVGIVLPLDPPFQIDVDLHGPPPPWLALSGAFLATTLMAVVASGALFLFRGWGRWLGAATGLGALVVAWLASGSPLVASLTTLAISLFALFAFVWLAVLTASFHPLIAVRFRHER